MTAAIASLSVPGAQLYYEVRGSGPVVLLIPSGNGDSGPLGPLAEELATTHTVITYDRRGFSRSPLTEPLSGTKVIADADDVARLLTHLTDEPAVIFGSSSGAIVALAALERYPRLIRRSLVHEAPLASVLPDAEAWLDVYHGLYRLYQQEGVEAARAAFRERMGMAAVTRPPRRTELPPQEKARLLARIRGNQVFWFEHELIDYPSYRPDIDVLVRHADRLLLVGSDTARTDFPYLPCAELAKHTGTVMAHLPGGHVGYVTDPEEFAAGLRALIA